MVRQFWSLMKDALGCSSSTVKLSRRTFFCEPHAPWQKGGIENAIGRMRRGLPRKTDLATLSEQRLLSLVRSYNHTPRKCLDYKTPAEVFCHNLLHLKCESTAPFASGDRSRARCRRAQRLNCIADTPC